MNQITRLLIAAALMLPAWARTATACRFAYQFNAGSQQMTSGRFQTSLSAGWGVSGQAGNDQHQTVIGYRPVAEAIYAQCYLTDGFPLAVRVAPGSLAASRLVTSPERTMRLAWTDGRNGVPVEYEVYFGADPSQLGLATKTPREFLELSELDYSREYYWRIRTVDVYGRATWSAGVFNFSIAPALEHLYCAPNPFRAGSQSTTFIFGMPAAGSARLTIYALPHADLVYSTRLENLPPGPNTWVYDGRDGLGKTLFSGVYMAQLEKEGGFGNETERFRFIVAR